MTNSFAFWLGVFVFGALAIDVLFYGTEHLLFLAKKGFDLIDWIAFWR